MYMPTYEYICLSCGYRFERFQGMSDQPLESCPECEGIVKRMITGGSGFIMKGTKATSDLRKSACGSDTTCCGRDSACGKSADCHRG
jgi:putative FmdB family regulatory protein